MGQYSLGIRWRPEELRSLDFTDVESTYVAFGTAMQNPIINYRIQNFTDKSVIISYDGFTDHDIVGGMSFVLFDVSSNKGKGEVLALTKGDIIYVKQESDAPTLGALYLSVYYASNN